MKQTALFLNIATVFCLMNFVAPVAEAQVISKLGQNNQVLLSFDSFKENELSVGAEFYALSPEGKKVAKIKITKVSGNRALGQITAGKALAGYKVQAKTATTGASGGAPTGAFHTKKGIASAILIGLGSNSMQLTAQYDSDGQAPPERSADVSLTGTSFNVKGLVELPFGEKLFARGIVGLETFTVTGTGSSAQGALCDNGNSTNCKVSFNYLALEGSGHYALSQSKKMRLHIGAGYSYLLTLSKDVNIYNLKATSSTNQMILAKLGMDFGTSSGNSWFPLSLEYGYIPGDNVKAGALYLRGGWGFYF